MKTITAEDVRKLREETGEGLMACKKILEERYAKEEKLEMYKHLWAADNIDSGVRKVLEYLIRKA